MNIAIIPARGGSKRVPGKNIKMFAGRPMISWPLKAALESALFQRVIVSTDDWRIAEIAEQYGAEVPFQRPAELADDMTPTAPVLLHALEWLCANGVQPDYICCIYPTSPFIMIHDLQRGFDIITKHSAPGAQSVTSFTFPILRAFKVLSDGSLAFNWPEYELARSQDLPEFYHDAGQFYWLDAKEFKKQGKLVMPGTLPVILPRKRVQDLDTLEDIEAAELMAKSLLFV